MCCRHGLSAARLNLKMSRVDDEDDAMYHHAFTASEIDGKAHTPVAKRSAASPERKVLVAFDGSPAARCALEYAIEQARDAASVVHAVNVQTALIDDAVFCRSHEQIGAEILRAATIQLDLHGIRHTTEVAFGAVAESIVRSAAMERCDAIVIGARDRLAIANFLSTSVSGQVVRLAQVPVTVIKQKVVATTHSPRHVWAGVWRPRT
jgi:nucleotide-binding universal stress UspA family protein